MLNIRNHPVWEKVTPWKKRAHLARIFLAKQYSKIIDPQKVIVVAGSVGKTTTTIAITKVLSEKFKVISTSDGSPNLDPVFNLPITILKSRPKTEKIVLEFGIEYPGEMDFYLSLIKPKTVVVTRLSYEHGEYLGEIEDILKEECKVIEKLKAGDLAVMNWDDLNSRKAAEKTKATVTFFGTDPQNCHIWADNIRIENFKTIFELNKGVERVEVVSSLLGKHQIYALLAAAAVGISNDIPLVSIRKGLEKVQPPEHRMQLFAGEGGSVILDDTYNAQPVAVEEALETLNQVSAKRRILILGEMRELGKHSDKFHREIARKIYKDKIDLVFLGDGDAGIIADELGKLGFPSARLRSNLTRDQIVEEMVKIISLGDVVLVKGARAVRLEEVVERLVKK